MKCTKIYIARAQLLFCSLNLLFGNVLVASVVVVCLTSLILANNLKLYGGYECYSYCFQETKF